MLEASRQVGTKSGNINTFLEAVKKRMLKQHVLTAFAGVKMRLPPTRELDFYKFSSPWFGTRNDTGLKTCPNPKHEKMNAMGHEVGILSQTDLEALSQAISIEKRRRQWPRNVTAERARRAWRRR